MIKTTAYQKLLNLQGATFSLIDHKDATVATVFKITRLDGEQFILKISERPNDSFREFQCLKFFKTLPVIVKRGTCKNTGSRLYQYQRHILEIFLEARK